MTDVEAEFVRLITAGAVDEAFKLLTDRRESAFNITPKEAQLVRAGLSAGRLLDNRSGRAPRLRPVLRLVET